MGFPFKNMEESRNRKKQKEKRTEMAEKEGCDEEF